MTLSRMLMLAVALLVPLVAVSLVTAELIAPVIDSRSLAAQFIAFTGYAASGLVGGFLFEYREQQAGEGFSAGAVHGRRALRTRLLMVLAILLVPLLALNLVVASNRAAFVMWELSVFTVLAVSAFCGYWIRRLFWTRRRH
jgi:hypothetical protein